MSRVTLFFALALAACVTPQNARAPKDGAPAPDPPRVDDATTARDVAELDRVSDPLNTYLALSQAPPKAFKPIPKARTGKFPGADFAEVRAYAMGFAPAIADPAPECDESAIAKDGTMCGRVVPPGAKLTAAQQAKLLDMVAHPDTAAPSQEARCSFEPRHSFVFFDASGAPVGEIAVSLACGEWRLSPLPPGASTTELGAHQAEMRALCEELKLGGCYLGDPTREDAVKVALDRRWREQTLPPVAPSGVDPGKRMDALAPDEKRRLCTWSAKNFSDIKLEPQAAFHCDDDEGSLLSWSDCVAQLPKCDAPVGEIEACMRYLVRDVCATSKESLAACDASAKKCLWGMRTKATIAGEAERAHPPHGRASR